MMDQELMKKLRCPETRQTLAGAGRGLIDRLNELIAARSLRDRSGRVVQEKLDGALVREDGRWLYPIRHDIPVMLIDQSIELAGELGEFNKEAEGA